MQQILTVISYDVSVSCPCYPTGYCSQDDDIQFSFDAKSSYTLINTRTQCTKNLIALIITRDLQQAHHCKICRPVVCFSL